MEKKWYYRKNLSYDELIEKLNEPEYEDGKSSWVFRGQLAAKELQSSLERNCEKSGIALTEAKHIEDMILREFRRLYDGEDRNDVMNDTLYCMSLLRHYGAPTRLLDFSYSKYVALYFGLKEAYDNIKNDPQNIRFDLWCIDVRDMNNKAKELYAADSRFLSAYNSRAHISKRDDTSFTDLYMGEKYEMVVSENPVRIHKRLHLQQGILLCPGKLSRSFMDNLHYIYNSGYTPKVKQLVCSLTISDLEKAFDDLVSMNITEESLFPGLDGHARGVRYQMWFYKRLYDRIQEEEGS
jgi:hypothetical protein